MWEIVRERGMLVFYTNYVQTIIKNFCFRCICATHHYKNNKIINNNLEAG